MERPVRIGLFAALAAVVTAAVIWAILTKSRAELTGSESVTPIGPEMARGYLDLDSRIQVEESGAVSVARGVDADANAKIVGIYYTFGMGGAGNKNITLQGSAYPMKKEFQDALNTAGL